MNDKEESHLTPHSLQTYIFSLQKLSVCSGKQFSEVCDESAFDINTKDIILEFDKINGNGRFRSVPAIVVFEAMRNGFEFCFKYADDILNSLLGVLESASKKGIITNTTSKNMDEIIKNNISSTLQAMGVKKYTIGYKNNNFENSFDHLRSDEGLIELYEVLLGSILVVLGSVAARRQGEIIDLHDDALIPDINPNILKNKNINFFLSFYNRKSGDETDRERLSRPIPRSVAGLIWKLKLFKKNLTDKKLIEPSQCLWVLFKKKYIARKS
ncbi:hypothetical protein [Spartinivicinus poritis]|uniref:Uncharacterized protein n=1 Tax=Spartinivicinus poritis TaxID=2994640 RepID=A0ABT5UAU8_9GAMM|nr:hypothetical protein [Spartinivicinus sp. A2-2]MDE1462583.1 hypothetical protein [Spartinivicinus sp. A2-2]